MTEPDEHLVRALVHDLDAGFSQLFESHRPVVFATMLKICGRWADAEDLTAESFVRAYRALSGYRRSRIMALRPRSWLLTIAVNLCRNQQRDASRRPPCGSLDDMPLAELPDSADVERVVARRETDRELTDLLAALPDEQRIAIVLRHVHDLSVAEIATALHRPAGTVKSDISRGLRRLRDLYPARALPGPEAGPPAATRRRPPVASCIGRSARTDPGRT